ncbi:hypothetical protein ACGFQG_20590 [Nocardia fluminea]|uniref:hypothetical protein n=1 Tax=Nocardia fluminea TaxID=134984 RepID=UPI0037135DA8
MREKNNEFIESADSAVQYLRSAGSHWSGDSYLAAYDRVAGDRDQAVRAAGLVESLAQTLIDGGDSLGSYRRVLLGRIDTAIEAGITVADDWSVSAAEGSDVANDDLEFHKTTIRSGIDELVASQTTIAAAVAAATADVESQATAIAPDGEGDGTPVSSALMNGADGDAATDPVTVAAAVSGAPVSAPTGTDANGSGANGSGGGTGAGAGAGGGSGADGSGAGAGTGAGGSSGKGAGTGAGGGSGAEAGDGSGGDSGGSGDDSGNSGSALNADSWTPSNVISLLGAIKGFTGDLPTILTSFAALDDDVDDIIKAAGEAGSSLVTASADAASKLGISFGDTDAGVGSSTGSGAGAGTDSGAGGGSGAGAGAGTGARTGAGGGPGGSDSQGSGGGTAPTNVGLGAMSGQTPMFSGRHLPTSEENEMAPSSLVGLPAVQPDASDTADRPSRTAANNDLTANFEFWSAGR